MPRVFNFKRPVHFHETDMAGVMYFANYFRLIEEIEQALLKSVGFSVSSPWEGGRLGFPRVNVSCDYRSPARFDDQLTLELRIRRLGSKSMSYEVTFRRDEEILAIGSLTGVCCVADGVNFKSIPIPEALRTRLAEFVHPVDE